MDSKVVIQPVIRNFRYLGVWPSLKHPTISKLWSSIMFILVGVIYPLSVAMNLLFIDSMNEFADVSYILSSIVLAILKGYFVFGKNGQLRRLLGIMDAIDAKILTKRHRDAHEEKLKTCRILYRIFVFLYLSAFAFIAFQTAFASKERRIWASTGHLPFGWSQNSYIYVGGIYFQGITNFAACFLGVNLDVYGIIFSNILLGYIRVLGDKLRGMKGATIVDCCKFYEDVLRYHFPCV